MSLVVLNVDKKLTSLEVSKMVGKTHSNLMKDIRTYVKQLAEVKIHSGDFFKENTYLDANNQTRPSFNITKKGCELVANKLTGAKGIQFTALYVNRFNEMEEVQKPKTQTDLLKLAVGSITEIDSRVTELEENQSLSPGDYGYISRIVNQKVRQVIAERQLNPNKKQRQLLYKELNSEIKKVTGTPTRSQLRQRHFELVTKFVNDWQPSSAALVIYKQLELLEGEAE